MQSSNSACKIQTPGKPMSLLACNEQPRKTLPVVKLNPKTQTKYEIPMITVIVVTLDILIRIFFSVASP